MLISKTASTNAHPRPFSLTTETFCVLSVFVFVHDTDRKDIARWAPKIIATQLFKPSSGLFMSEFLSELLTVRLFRFIILSHLCFMKIYYKESKFLQRWWKKKGTVWSQESKDTGIGKKKSRRQAGCLTVTRGDPHHARFNPQKSGLFG